MSPIHRPNPIISVFGASRLTPDHPGWAWAHRLGGLLAKAGYDVCTGGYEGAMEAVSRGAQEAGGHVVGVTMDIFEDGPNTFVSQEIRTADFFERLKFFTAHSAGYVVLHGGIGTLVELALVWNLKEVRLGDKPIVLVESAWRGLIGAMDRHLIYHSGSASHLLHLADTPEDAVRHLQSKISKPPPH